MCVKVRGLCLETSAGGVSLPPPPLHLTDHLHLVVTPQNVQTEKESDTAENINEICHTRALTAE